MENKDRMDFRLDEAQSTKITDWQKEPTLLQLKLDLEMSKPYHDAQMLRIQKWNDLLEIKGAAKPPKVKGRSSVQPKLIRRQAEWRYSALSEPFLGSNKLFKISPVTFEDESAAKQNELLLNHQFRTKLNRVKFIDDYVRSTVDEGTCIVRLGWDRTTTIIKESVPVYSHFQLQSEEQLQAFQQALEVKQSNPREYAEQTDPSVKAAIDLYLETGSTTTAVQTGTQEVDVEKVLENKPTVEILNPQNFYVDPSCNGDINKALFAVVSFETNQAELKKKPNTYKNLDKVNWETATPLTEQDHATLTPDTFQFKDLLRKKVIAYEYWGFYDIEGNGVLTPIIVTWIGDTIIRMELNPFPDGKLPFVMVPYLPVKRDLYGEPDAELLEDNQAILGAVTRGMIDLLGRSANSQIGFAKGLLDPLNRRKYDDGRDYEYNPSSNPEASIINHKYPELPQSGLAMLGIQNQEAEALTGVKSFSGGISSESYGDVAAGIRGALDAASKREMAILRRLAKGMVDIGQKIIAMNGDFLSEEEVVRVTNAEFITIKREELAGQFDLEVDISTAEVDNAKSQDLAFMLQTMGPNMDISISMMILAEIAELKRMPVLAHRLRTYQPQPSPEEQEMQRLALEKAQLENQELQSKIALNEAKARQAQSDADKTDLDYVEQETGTTHARNMQQQQGQSRGNQNLEITKALTKPRKEGESAPDIEAAVGFNELSKSLNNEGLPENVDNSYERDIIANENPRFNLGSRFFDPRQDPSLNPNIRI